MITNYFAYFDVCFVRSLVETILLVVFPNKDRLFGCNHHSVYFKHFVISLIKTLLA